MRTAKRAIVIVLARVDVFLDSVVKRPVVWRFYRDHLLAQISLELDQWWETEVWERKTAWEPPGEATVEEGGKPIKIVASPEPWLN